MEAHPTLAEALRGTRLKANLSQEELAGRLGLSQSTISFWENGVETPTLENLVNLATELPGVVSFLIAGEAELLQRLERLERLVYGGRCGCTNCGCGGG